MSIPFLITAGGYPRIVFTQIVNGVSTVTGSYSTVYTTPSAGLYRIQVGIYAQTLSTTSWVVEIGAQVNKPNGAAGIQSLNAAQQNINASNFSSQIITPWIVSIGAGQVIQIGSFTVSGANTNGLYSYSVSIEQLA